ncbi:MAG: lipoate--protein ligase family protein [Candidatus Rokubacteria bacterium]|nr:lipoate--protein ligase family protein [Candidatus Rokubacteria bacterium]
MVTEPLDGATNMAIDEALLRSRIAGDGRPTLRFFGWAPPTVSLGYGQPVDGRIDLAACARLGVGLVRRPTGGSAILHESPASEVTYSVAARAGDFPGGDDLLETYRILATALAAGLARLGVQAEVVPRVRGAGAPSPTFCFARTGAYEIAVAGKKLVGSAQRRQGGALLQHGSILLDADPGRLGAVFPGVVEPMSGVTTAAVVLGRRVGFDEVVGALTAGFGEALGPLVPGGLSLAERELATRLVTEKYASDAWTFQPAATGSAPARRGRRA